MGRSESKQAFNDSTAIAKQDQANAQTSLGNENQAVADYKGKLDSYGNDINSEFGEGGKFTQNQNLIASTNASGGQNSFKDFLSNTGKTTGTGTTPQMVAASEEASRQGRRDMATEEANAENQRVAALEHGQEFVAQGYGSIPGIYGQQYSTGVGGANSAEGNATSAAKTPGFWDTFGPALIQGAAGVGAAFAGKPPVPGAKA